MYFQLKKMLELTQKKKLRVPPTVFVIENIKKICLHKKYAPSPLYFTLKILLNFIKKKTNIPLYLTYENLITKKICQHTPLLLTSKKHAKVAKKKK